MRIAVLGAGAIGSTFAWYLARGGHQVTVIARGARLARLQADQGLTMASGERTPVDVAAALDEAMPWDLVLVTVLATQVGAVLPALGRSAARKVMFMFNTFEPLEPLREAVGTERFEFGFPGGVFTRLIDGKMHTQVRVGTTAGSEAWARVFSDAGIPSVSEPDMQSWLRTHAALVVPLMAIGTTVYARGSGISWREAASHALAFATGFRIVRAMGNELRPVSVAKLSRLPSLLVTALLWAMSRSKMLRELGELGAAEPRMLIDMMSAARPELAGPLLAIRP